MTPRTDQRPGKLKADSAARKALIPSDSGPMSVLSPTMIATSTANVPKTWR